MQVGEAAAFVRSDDLDLFPPSQYPPETKPEDRTTGEGAPDIELFTTPVTYFSSGVKGPACPGEYTFGLHAVVLRYADSATTLPYPT